ATGCRHLPLRATVARFARCARGAARSSPRSWKGFTAPTPSARACARGEKRARKERGSPRVHGRLRVAFGNDWIERPSPHAAGSLARGNASEGPERRRVAEYERARCNQRFLAFAVVAVAVGHSQREVVVAVRRGCGASSGRRGRRKLDAKANRVLVHADAPHG